MLGVHRGAERRAAKEKKMVTELERCKVTTSIIEVRIGGDKIRR
jgi:hypothetical protein